MSCILWKGAHNKKGYGHRTVDGKTISAHRYAYQQHYGQIPKGLHVLHTCDNPSCINPTHLWLGTNKDNVLDRVSKGRSNRPIGEQSGMAKYTQEEVQLIRAHPGPLSSIVAEFGISKSQASKIRNYKCWM